MRNFLGKFSAWLFALAGASAGFWLGMVEKMHAAAEARKQWGYYCGTGDGIYLIFGIMAGAVAGLAANHLILNGFKFAFKK